uniref:Uncharacterized protein n=1 Tax=Triticum urartu TaxID=4572 RepID=A0A8R7VGN3_TRIUA
MSGFEAVRCRERGDSRHMHELLAHVSKAGGAPRVQHGKVQENGQSLGTSCEEAVGGDAELRGDIHGDTAEEVHHQDGRGGAVQEVTELRTGGAGGLEGHRLRMDGVYGRELDPREAVEGDGGVDHGDVGQERPGSARVVRRLDDDDGDGEAVSGQDFAELGHGDKVAQAGRRV